MSSATPTPLFVLVQIPLSPPSPHQRRPHITLTKRFEPLCTPCCLYGGRSPPTYRPVSPASSSKLTTKGSIRLLYNLYRQSRRISYIAITVWYKAITPRRTPRPSLSQASKISRPNQTCQAEQPLRQIAAISIMFTGRP